MQLRGPLPRWHQIGFKARRDANPRDGLPLKGTRLLVRVRVCPAVCLRISGPCSTVNTDPSHRNIPSAHSSAEHLYLGTEYLIYSVLAQENTGSGVCSRAGETKRPATQDLTSSRWVVGRQGLHYTKVKCWGSLSLCPSHIHLCSSLHRNSHLILHFKCQMVLRIPKTVQLTLQLCPFYLQFCSPPSLRE